ncbi:hypothetical protein BA190_16925 [Labrys sp. WJW]|uniref:autotransporter outer membrane beta-barrel domain-containing protein n=1 Tax=Labrys sp. WJW TaxID=1737983 RepID=UPI000835FDFA|nr:autotransporter domain-containing protein [Labrys sp. WJW]OCC03769.1 hypothetical protein BA190_16925 [Labrys sp. WJW]
MTATTPDRPSKPPEDAAPCPPLTCAHPKYRLRRAAWPCLAGLSLLAATSLPALAVEPWIMVEKTMFSGVDASRGQGVTTDGTNWYFSGTNALEMTNGSFDPKLLVTPAIPDILKNPSQFSDIGLNHIGDIDYADGKLYISLDTSNRSPTTNEKYERPVFAIYDAKTLTYLGQAFALNPPHGTHDVASWVAVDAKNGVGYGMAYENATELAVYNISDWSFQKYIPLSQTIDQAQGGKIFNGWMYFSTDNDQKLIYRANLLTGQVELIGNLKIDGEQEIEGLVFKNTPDGWSMHILNREEDPNHPGETAIGFYRYVRPFGNALSGEIHADIKGALIEDSRYPRDAANRRLRSAFGGIAGTSGGVATGSTDGIVVWGTPFAATGRAEGSGDAASFDRTSGGFIGGIDAPVGDWRLGVLAGYSHTSFDVSARSSDGSSNNYQVGLYGGTRWGQLGFRTGAIYGWHNVDTKRNVVFPAFRETLSGHYDAATAQAFGELSYRFDLGRNVFEPFANLAYVHLDTNGFAEKGGTTAALASPKSSTDMVYTTLGLHASTAFDLAGTTLTLRGTLGWQHAFDDVTQNAKLAFNNGASFTIAGAPLAKDALAVEAGVDVALSANATLGATYSGQLASHTQGHAFRINLDMKL